MDRSWLHLCLDADLEEGESLRVPFDGDSHAHGLCVLKRHGKVHAYLNRCPHQDMAMDWLPGRFLDPSGEHIVCAMHGAQFQAEDGLCVAGPCLGRSLVTLPVERRGDAWVVCQEYLHDYCD